MKWLTALVRRRILLAKLFPVQPARKLFYFCVFFITLAAFVEGVLAPGVLIRQHLPERRTHVAAKATAETASELPASEREEHPIARAIEYAIGGVEWQAQKDKEKREVAARALEAKVRRAHVAAGKQLTALEGLQNDFAHELRATLGVNSEDSPLPDELLMLLADEPSAAEAWAIIRSYTVPKRATGFRETIGLIENRMALGTFHNEDVDELAGVTTSITAMGNTFPEQRRALRHLKTMFDAKQFMQEDVLPKKGTRNESD